MTRKSAFFLLFLIAASGSVLADDLVITATENADCGTKGSLCETILGDTTGLSGLVGGFTGNGPGSFFGSAAGTFVTNNMGVGKEALDITHGIILSTGLAVDAAGPNDRPDIETFHFTADMAGTLSLSFILGSEEWDEFLLFPFWDGFGIFIKDAATGAVLDGSITNSSQVGVGGVNSLPGGIDNNDSGFPGDPIGDAPRNVQYDGLTALLTESFFIGAGDYVLKLVIADTKDQFQDSGVFINANSLNFAPIPEPGTLLLFGSGLAGMFSAYRKRRQS